MNEIKSLEKIVDQVTGPLKLLFGASIDEVSMRMADNFRLRRFKNQLKILEKAEKLVKKEGISPKSIDFKILAPIVNYISLEEDPVLQEKWASLIKNIVTVEGYQSIKLICSDILSKISNEEASFFDFLISNLEKKRENTIISFWDKIAGQKHIDKIRSTFHIKEVSKLTEQPSEDINSIIAKLCYLGIIRMVPVVENNRIRASLIPKLTPSRSFNVFDKETFEISTLGFQFYRLCQPD